MVGFMVEQLLRKESATTVKSGLGQWTWLLRREVLAAFGVFVLDAGVGKRNKFRSFCQKFFHSQVNFSMGQGFLLRHLCLASRISSDLIKTAALNVLLLEFQVHWARQDVAAMLQASFTRRMV